MEFCSPSANKRKFCYSKESLEKIIKNWNILCPYKNDKIIINPNDSLNDIISKINEKFKKYTKKDNIYWAWVDLLKREARYQKKQTSLNELLTIERKDLRPSQPKEWVKNPVEWLSNFDIIKVLKQYEDIPENKYKFLGVFSIDFGLKKDGVCQFSQFCNIDIKEILESGNVKYLGFVTNLSRSNEAGTHWTSSFFVLDPSLPSFGGYYYDSTTGNIPNDLKPVFADIKSQAEKLFKKPFPIEINTIRHQRSNTECGVFSIAFQLLWLNFLKRDKNTKLEKIIKLSEYTDAKMKKLRFRYFRPNISSII